MPMGSAGRADGTVMGVDVDEGDGDEALGAGVLDSEFAGGEAIPFRAPLRGGLGSGNRAGGSSGCAGCCSTLI